MYWFQNTNFVLEMLENLKGFSAVLPGGAFWARFASRRPPERAQKTTRATKRLF